MGHAVAGDMRISADQRETFLNALGDQQEVEGVSMSFGRFCTARACGIVIGRGRKRFAVRVASRSSGACSLPSDRLMAIYQATAALTYTVFLPFWLAWRAASDKSCGSV